MIATDYTDNEFKEILFGMEKINNHYNQRLCFLAGSRNKIKFTL
jgi:hypothetical protein